MIFSAELKNESEGYLNRKGLDINTDEFLEALARLGGLFVENASNLSVKSQEFDTN